VSYLKQLNYQLRVLGTNLLLEDQEEYKSKKMEMVERKVI
jgi:hypothetical protein